MDQLMVQDIKKDIVYYGVYSSPDDPWNGSDVLCTGRKRFFETGAKQKKRSTVRSEGMIYHYNYSIEDGVILKYKKMKAGHQVERVIETQEGYCVESLGERQKPCKRAYFDLRHRWLRTEYLNESDRGVSLLIAPGQNEDRASVICKSQKGTEVLFPFDVNLDKEMTRKLNIMTSEPRIFCVTNCGSFYFCTEEEYKTRRQALDKLLKESAAEEEKETSADSEERTSAFVVDESALSGENEGVFDLKNSPQINVDKPRESEEQTGPAEISGPDAAGDSAGSVEQDTSVSAAGTDTVSTEVTENFAAAPQEDHPDDTNVDNRSTISPSAADSKRSRSKKTSSKQQRSKKPPAKPAEALPDEAAEPVAESIFKKENSQNTQSQRACTFVSECPYERVDKQIIESGGKQYYYFGDIENDLRSGRGRTVMKNGETAYEGGYKEDKRSEFGVYYFKSGKLCYAGNWDSNRRQGLGAAFSPTDGSVFVGKWQEDVSVETAAHFDSSGNMLYAGSIENGQRSGAGMTYDPEGETFFIGKYRDGRFLGTGTQFDREGNLLYTGGFHDNCRSGKGTSYNKDGSVLYRGDWLQDEYNGQGVLYLEDGGSISGSFKNGRAHGKCTLTNAQGNIIYVGSFMDDKYNGTGRLFTEEGGYAEGRFVDGEPTGIFNEYDSTKHLVYCGEWADMRRNGRGIAYCDGEKLYEGSFCNSVYEGEGKLYENGSAVYSGSFHKGSREGFGVEYMDNNILYKGLWKNDQYNGCGILFSEGEAKYVGMFRDGQRSGRINEIKGRSVIRKSLYEKDELVYTCEYSQDGSLLYYGNISAGQRSGMGCSFGENAEKQFEGIFRSNEPEKPMKVLLKELSELPVCEELKNTEYELYRVTPEYIIEKNIIVGSVPGIYTGRLKNGLPNGGGTILYSDHRYTGFFADGKPEGEGIVYLGDGEERRGFFSSSPFPDCQTLILSDITYFFRSLT